MSDLIFKVMFRLSGRDNVVIESVFYDEAACHVWAGSYAAHLPGFEGYAVKPVGTVSGRVAAVWSAMGAPTRRAMVARHRATMERLISGGVPAGLAFRVGHKLIGRELTELAMNGGGLYARQNCNGRAGLYRS